MEGLLVGDEVTEKTDAVQGRERGAPSLILLSLSSHSPISFQEAQVPRKFSRKTEWSSRRVRNASEGKWASTRTYIYQGDGSGDREEKMGSEAI